MDQMLGAVLRGLEVPSTLGDTGLRSFLDLVCSQAQAAKTLSSDGSFWQELTDNWDWEYSSALESPGLFVAIRAWATEDPDAQDLVEDWLYNPRNYYSLRKQLYTGLVQDLRHFFRDPRPDWQFYADGVFVFNPLGHHQSWAALRDLDRLAREAGLKGLVILFDEFEDVLTNLTNIKHKQDAFWNLFQFFGGKKFPGLSFFAVTPDFAYKCKTLLLEKGIWDYDYSKFDKLDKFEMSPLGVNEMIELAGPILEAHKQAYSWGIIDGIEPAHFTHIIEKSMKSAVQDRTRRTITNIVAVLDELYERRCGE